MAKNSSISIPNIGSDDKRSITDTFIVTLGGQFLAIQLIYGEKTVQSLSILLVPDYFCHSANPKHYSNTQESVIVITEILVTYVEKQHQQLKKSDHATPLIMDVFRDQITDDVTSLLQQHKILLVLIPNTMSKFK